MLCSNEAEKWKSNSQPQTQAPGVGAGHLEPPWRKDPTHAQTLLCTLQLRVRPCLSLPLPLHPSYSRENKQPT